MLINLSGKIKKYKIRVGSSELFGLEFLADSRSFKGGFEREFRVNF